MITNSEFFVVTVKSEEVTGYNQKKGEDIVKKYKEDYLVRAASPQQAVEKVAKDMQGCTWDWRVTGVKESTITKVLD